MSSTTSVPIAPTSSALTARLSYGAVPGDTVTLFADGSYILDPAGLRTDRATGKSALRGLVVDDLPLTGPDAAPFSSTYQTGLAIALAASVDAMRADGGGTRIQVDGRASTRVTGRVSFVPGLVDDGAGATPSVREIDATIDDDTGLLRSWSDRVVGASAMEPQTMSAPMPVVASPSISDVAVARTGPAPFRALVPGAATGLSYRTLDPRLPASYAKTFLQVAVGRTQSSIGASESDPTVANPASANVAIAAYRAGYREVVLTMRDANPLAVDPPPIWGDPYGQVGGSLSASRSTYISSGGAWAGVSFTVVAGLGTMPHAWAIHDGLVLTIGGPLTPAQIHTAIDTLQPST